MIIFTSHLEVRAKAAPSTKAVAEASYGSACLEGIIEAHKLGLPHIVVESNCSKAVRLLFCLGRNPMEGSAQHLLDDCRKIISPFLEVSVYF